jgi:AcrR family transcriptional regulator
MAKSVNSGNRDRSASEPVARRGRGTGAARATERAIVEAADRLFLTRGYVGTTMEAVAQEAGVVVQTIYNSVGNKQALLSRVLDYTAAGPQAPTAVPDTLRAATAAAPDADRLVRLLSEWFAELQPRLAPLMRTIQEGAAVAPEVDALEKARAEQRFLNYHEAARAFAARADSKPMKTPEAAALIWTVGHPSIYRFLVMDQGWTLPRYQHWIESILRAALVEEPPGA